MPAPYTRTVLVVDDEEPIRDYLAAVLRLEGYECVCVEGTEAALNYLEQSDADLVLTDINMPGQNGIDLLRSVRRASPDLPVVLVSGLYELGIALDALESGAADYLKKPVLPSDVITLVSKYLRKDISGEETAIRGALREVVAERTNDRATSRALEEIFLKLGFKRYETLQHSKRVAAYCCLFGQKVGLGKDQIRQLELGALLHDIGKIGIPHNVLLKPGPLTEDEWDVMRTHPSIGHRLLIEIPELRYEAEMIYSHHERFDGRGYPRGLRGREIPIGARIFSIIDTLDAIASDRPYRAAASIQDARHEIASMSETQFDPDLVRVFLRIPSDQLSKICRSYPDQTAEADPMPALRSAPRAATADGNEPVIETTLRPGA